MAIITHSLVNIDTSIGNFKTIMCELDTPTTAVPTDNEVIESYLNTHCSGESLNTVYNCANNVPVNAGDFIFENISTLYVKVNTASLYFLYTNQNSYLSIFASYATGYFYFSGGFIIYHGTDGKYTWGSVTNTRVYTPTSDSHPSVGTFGEAVFDTFSAGTPNNDINVINQFTASIAPDIIPTGYLVSYDLSNCVGDGDNPVSILPEATITNFVFVADTDYSFVFNSVYIDGDGFPEGTPIIYDWDPDTGHLKIGPVTSNITIHVHAYTDPYSDLPVDGETDIPGGDVIPIPSLPGLGAVSAGVIGLFAPSPSQMQALANYMWTDFGGTGTTVEDILTEIVEALKRAIANPLDYVVGLNIIPSQGLSVGSDRAIRFGFTNSGVSMPQLTSQYFVVDCGTLRFDTLCGDTFLDYAPYSKFSIYLPYVGIKEVDANDFVGHTIGVVYHGDVVTGGVTAYITKDGSVMYQYSGCCALNVPLSSDGWGSTIAGAVQIATSLVAGGFAGGAAGVAESAVKGAAAAAANPSLLSPKVQHSGAVSGGAGCMGIQTPFVIREAVRFHSTAGMNTVSGYPSFYYKSLGSVSGYTVVLDVHLKGIPATSEEIAEIESLLKSGVVL